MNPLELLSAPGFNTIRFLLLAVLILASVTDLHRRRIPNLFTFPTALLAFIVHAASGGLAVLVASVLAFLAWFALGFLFYRTLAGREIGAGDIKLVMATSACIGFIPAAYVTFVSLLLVVLWLFVRWIAQGTAGANFSGLYAWLRALATPGLQRIHFRPVGMVDRTPHAPFMLLGAVICYTLYRNGILIRF
jgi:Flp pilus assembly protein protease CpaA